MTSETRTVSVTITNGDNAERRDFTVTGDRTLTISLDDGQTHTVELPEPAQRLSGEVALDTLTIPPGEVVEFDPARDTTLTLRGNLIVEGTLRMRPTNAGVEHVIRFVDIDETRFVGGAMDPVDTDVGLWVMGDGVLDAAGTPRERWNRTGQSETWQTGDETMVAPNVRGDYTFRTFTPGDTVPTVTAPDGDDVATEVFNLTTNVRIEGTEGKRAHVFIHSQQPQHIAHVGLRHMGPRVPTQDGSQPVLGRYPIHFHHGEDAARGSSVIGAVVRDSSRAFVPHGAHGIAFIDCVAYNITDDAYWWDVGHQTHDTLWRHCAAFDVARHPAYRGATTGFLLGNGDDNTIEDCVAAVIAGFESCSGVHWPEMAAAGFHSPWHASGIVVHNSRGTGVRVWQNDDHDHLVTDTTCYNNEGHGWRHGAYGNRYRIRGLTGFGNGRADLMHQAIPSLERAAPQEWDRITLDELGIGEHNKNKRPATTYPVVMTEVKTSRIRVNEAPPPNFGSGTYEIHTADGWPLTPEDVTVVELYSTIHVHNTDGSSFTLTP